MALLTFLNPWLLLGLTAAVLPVVIHLIGRRRAPVVFFAAMDFLLAVNKRLARRERIRQILLLTLRTLAVIGLVLAAARPVSERPSTVVTASTRLGIVIDTSASMAYIVDGERLLDRAKKQARELLATMQPGDTVAVVAAGPAVRSLLPGPTGDGAAARAAIERLQIGGGTADLGAAMEAVVAQFGEGTTRLVLAVVSDLAQNSFRGIRQSATDPPPDVRLIDAAARRPLAALDNVSVESVRVESAGGSPLTRRFTLLLHNYGNEPVSGRGVELSCGGDVRLRGHLELPPRSTQQKVFTYTFDKPGIFDAEIRLARDARDGYDLDDRYLFSVHVAKGVHVLAVDGDPSATPYDDELFFLERGLAAVPRGDPPIDLQIVSSFDLSASAYDLTGIDVVILANVAALAPAGAARLSAFVKSGGGLLITLGSQIRFEQANVVFGSVLPHPLRDLHLASDSAAGTPPVGITWMDWDHPVMRGLGPAAEESLRTSRTSRYFNLDVGADRSTRPILRFENGAPALVEARQAGTGRVLLLTSSIDRDMSDLVLRSVFPALIQRTVRYLALGLDTGNPRELRQYAEIDLALPTEADGVALRSPSGVRRVLAVSAGGRVTAHGMDEVGFYRAEISERGRFHPAPDLDIAVSPDLTESDFSPVSVAQVQAAFGKRPDGREITVAMGAEAAESPFDGRGLSSILLLVVCLTFVGESLLAARG